jgi:hypothetical protein
VKLFQRAKRLLPKANRSTWLYVFVPTCVAFTLLLGTGPALQQSISSTLTAEAPSLYGAAFQEGVVQSPSLGEWLASAFDPFLIAIAVITTLVALSSKRRTNAPVRAAVCAVALLIINDARAVLIGSDAQSFGQSVIFDVIGGIFVWLFFVVLLLLLDQSRTAFRTSMPPRFAYPALAIGLGATISAVVLGLFQLFYNAAPVRFAATISAPTAGYFIVPANPSWHDEDASHPPERDHKPLSIVPPQVPAKRAEFQSPGEQLSVAWRRVADEIEYDVEIRLYADCPFPKAFDRLPKAEPITFRDVGTLSAAFSKGHSMLKLEHEGTRKYNLAVPDLAQYWLKAEPGSDIASIEAFVGERDTLSLDPDNGVRFYLSAPLTRVVRKISHSASRTLTFKADQRAFSVSAGGARVFSQEKLGCRAAKPQFATDGQNIEGRIPDAQSFFFLSALVELKGRPRPSSKMTFPQSEMKVSGGNGWVELFDIDFPYVLDRNLGRGGGFIANRNVTRLIVDGVAVPTDVESDLVAVGTLDADLQNKAVQVDGKAYFLWHNRIRQNPTTWERLPTTWQVALASAFLALLGFISRWLWPRVLVFVKKDKPLDLRID